MELVDARMGKYARDSRWVGQARMTRERARIPSHAPPPRRAPVPLQRMSQSPTGTNWHDPEEDILPEKLEGKTATD